MARCPAHDDRDPSLSIRDENGKVLVHCYAGCSQADVIAALKALGLWPERELPILSPEERRARAQEQREIARHLPSARLWLRTALDLAEEVSDQLKEAIGTPTPPPVGEVARWWQQSERWRRLKDGKLVAEYEWWRQHSPKLTTGMVAVARNREAAEMRALRRYLGFPPEAK
jgi:hypothetical protein